MICLSSAGMSGIVSRRSCIEPSGPLRTTRFTLPNSASLRGSRRGNGRRGFPCARGRSGAMASETVRRCLRSRAVCQPGLYSRWPWVPALAARALSLPIDSRAGGHFVLAADDADQVLHHALELPLDLIRSFGIGLGAVIERFERLAGGLPRSGGRRFSRPGFSLENLAANSPARLPKTRRSGERVAAEPVRAVETGGAFARGEEARDGSRLGLSIDTDAAHDVWVVGPISIGSLVMSRLASCMNWWYMLGSFFLMCSAALGIFSLIQEMSRKTPPCGAAAAGLDLAVDAAGRRGRE